jgi:hypothetical protein
MENNDKKIDQFIDRLMSSDALEQPTKDFTDKVMLKIESIHESTALVYKPLISKSVWFVILGCFMAAVASVYVKEPIANNGWFNKFEWSNIYVNPFENLVFSFSPALMYAFVFLTLMIGIQVPLLKHYFNKRMAF